MNELTKLAIILRALNFGAKVERDKVALKDRVIDNSHVAVTFGRLYWSIWPDGKGYEVHLDNDDLYDEYYCIDRLCVVSCLAEDIRQHIG